nr:3762_t:CDS:2 [Entrophospora candida]
MFRSISQVMFSNGVEADGLTDKQFKETNLFNGFDIGLIKEIIKTKLMQLQAGFGVQLDKDMDEIPTPLQ